MKTRLSILVGMMVVAANCAPQKELHETQKVRPTVEQMKQAANKRKPVVATGRIERECQDLTGQYERKDGAEIYEMKITQTGCETLVRQVSLNGKTQPEETFTVHADNGSTGVTLDQDGLQSLSAPAANGARRVLRIEWDEAKGLLTEALGRMQDSSVPNWAEFVWTRAASDK